MPTERADVRIGKVAESKIVIYLLGLFTGIPGFLLLVALVFGGVALINNDPVGASNYASFASGLASIILVAVTFWYARATSNLVEETRLQREMENQRREEEL